MNSPCCSPRRSPDRSPARTPPAKPARPGDPRIGQAPGRRHAGLPPPTSRRARTVGRPSGASDERKLAERFPTSSWSAVDHFLTGEQAYRRNDLKLAIESFRHSLSIQPDRFWAQYFLAVCLLKDHRPAEAQSALIACQSRRPGFAWTYLLKGFAEGEMQPVRSRRGRLPPGERASAQRPGALRDAGQPGRDADPPGDATRTPSPTCPEAIALKPGQFEAYINLATGLQKLGRLSTRRSRPWGGRSRAIRREAVLYRARSQVYRGLSRGRRKSLDDLRAGDRALMPADDPASAADHLEIALILQRTGRREESLAACDRALRLRPNRPEIHRVRGRRPDDAPEV